MAPGDRIDIPSVPNLRDIGGYAVAGGGRVRAGQLYRSTELNHLGGDDVSRFGELGIRTVVDLRTAAEREAEPDVAVAGAEEVICDVLADSSDAAPADLLPLLADPAGARERLGDGKAAQMFEGAYREIVSLPSALVAYREMITRVADEGSRPLLFHCTTGKDRTGWGAAAILLLLGVSEDDVLADYLHTNRDLLPALTPVFEQFRAAGGDPHMLEPVLGVDAEYLRVALDEMTTTFGSIEGYFADGLGIDAAAQADLRSQLIESDG